MAASLGNTLAAAFGTDHFYSLVPLIRIYTQLVPTSHSFLLSYICGLALLYCNAARLRCPTWPHAVPTSIDPSIGRKPVVPPSDATPPCHSERAALCCMSYRLLSASRTRKPPARRCGRSKAYLSIKNHWSATSFLQSICGVAFAHACSLYLPQQISFARTRSDAVVAKVDSAAVEKHKAERLDHKRRQRFNNPHAVKSRAKRKAEKGASSYPLLPGEILTTFPTAVEGAAPVPVTKRPNVLMPDEYLPPNKILFLQNLPESVTKDQLDQLFSQYVLGALAFVPPSTLFHPSPFATLACIVPYCP